MNDRVSKNSGFNTGLYGGDNPIVNAISISIAATSIREYLRRSLLGDDRPDVIISTLRKGSWIIEDMLLRETDPNLKMQPIEHYFYEKTKKIKDFNGKKVVIFDDSIHTGETVCGILSQFNNPKDVRVCCIAINDAAVKKITQMIPEQNLTYMKRFKEYDVTYENGIVSPNNQSIFYARYMLPFIGTLSVNRSPDFPSLIIRTDVLDGTQIADFSKDLLQTCPYQNRKSFRILDNLPTQIRSTIDLNHRSVRKLFGCEVIDIDLAKIRLSVVNAESFSLITFTPMICPIVESDKCDYRPIQHYVGRQYIDSVAEELLQIVEKNGKHILSATIVMGDQTAEEGDPPQ